MNRISDTEFFFYCCLFSHIRAVTDKRNEGVKFVSKLMCEVTVPQWNKIHYYLS